MRTPWQPAAVVLAALLMSACSWNPLSRGGSSAVATPCFYTQGGQPTGDCAPRASAVDDDGKAADAVLTASVALSAIGQRLSDAPVAPPTVIAAFNAIGNSAALMEPRVFEADRGMDAQVDSAIVAQYNPEEEVYLTARVTPVPKARRTTVTPKARIAAQTPGNDRFTGIIRVVRPGMPTGAVVPIPSGSALTAMVAGASVPQQRNFQIGVTTSGTGSARLRMLLSESASGSTSGTSGGLRYRTSTSSSSASSLQERYDASPENRAQADATRTNRLTATLSNDGTVSSTGSGRSGSSQHSDGREDAATTASSSSSSRPSILERLGSGASSSSSRPSILDRLRGGKSSVSSGANTNNTGGGTATDDGWTPRGTLVRTGGDAGSSDASTRGTLVSGNGSASSDDWTPQGTLVRTGGSNSSDSSFTPAQREHCPRNRSLIGALFTDDSATVGSPGWTFPGLINGDCPMGVGVLKINDEGSPFGSMNF